MVERISDLLDSAMEIWERSRDRSSVMLGFITVTAPRLAVTPSRRDGNQSASTLSASTLFGSKATGLFRPSPVVPITIATGRRTPQHPDDSRTIGRRRGEMSSFVKDSPALSITESVIISASVLEDVTLRERSIK